MRPLPSFGISGWSWLNSLGAHSHLHGEPTPAYLLDRRALTHQALSLPGSWGRVEVPLSPLPARMARCRSRSAELLLQTLRPLAPRLERARDRYGSSRVAIVLGSSTGGIDASEQALAEERRTGSMPNDFVFQEAHVYHALVRLVREAHGIDGHGFVISTACSSSGKALAAAQRLLALGWADVVLTGGVDALCEMTLRGFAGLGILAPESCKPFDAERNGISIGEGAALLLLERDSDSPFRLLGVGESSDAFHATAPHPEGLGARLAMERALGIANSSATAVGYVNAHGTGTQQNDQAEARALAEVFGERVRYSSTKDRVGHQLGTAGATEALFCLHAMQTETLPENRLPERCDTALAVQPLIERLSLGVDTVASNSFAFGGSNVSVILGRREAHGSAPVALPTQRLFVVGSSLWSHAAADFEAWRAVAAKSSFEVNEAVRPAAECLPARARGRASLLTRMFAELHDQLARRHAEFDPSDIALVVGSAYGEMDTTLALLDQLAVDPTLSPARFQSSVHNTAAGLLSLTTQNRGFATAVAAGPSSFAATLGEAMAWLSTQGGQAFGLVADEVGPARMMRGETFPALAVGVHLVAAETPPAAALAEITDFSLAEAVEQPGDTPEAYWNAPAAWGLELLTALAEGRQGRVRIGPRATVVLARS
ncbi:MAG TPA: beta-ketoacyl synthase N-terminal-like domain-containing protein [Polyangiaceae bacterium]|nr:beta-ketoacyl synthase N-terminal-like domain-containing protein [Polyangiaceae bacterium]